MKKKHFKLKEKYKTAIILFAILSLSIFFSNIYYKNNVKKEQFNKSYRIKLSDIGYSKKEIEFFLTLNNNSLDYIISLPKNSDIYKFWNQKYFLEKNLNKYLEYKSQNPETELDEIISIINTQANNNWYTNDQPSDLNKNNLVLVNKHYYLNKEYKPDMVLIPTDYAYANNYIKEEAYNAYLNMYNVAKQNNIFFVITSSYRSYEDQKNLYDSYKKYYGEEKVEMTTAQAGYSEYQTGLTLDIFTINSNINNFHETEAYKWLKDNSYKYGFILRYPEGKEQLTGFSNKSWHYRYIGIEAATQIYEENITFEEYYAYYIEK